MDIQHLNRAIMLGTWTNVELNSMIDAIKWNRNQLMKQVKRSITLGDNVNFTSTKTGTNKTGVVTKIAQKYVTIRCIDGLWRVPANMLTVVE